MQIASSPSRQEQTGMRIVFVKKRTVNQHLGDEADYHRICLSVLHVCLSHWDTCGHVCVCVEQGNNGEKPAALLRAHWLLQVSVCSPSWANNKKHFEAQRWQKKRQRAKQRSG